MQKAGNIWGCEANRGGRGSFYILPGEERGIKEREERGEREGGDLRMSEAGCGRGELSHSRLLIRNVRLMGVRVPGN